MEFVSHPLLPNMFYARGGKFSFIVSLNDDGWHSSWQDQVKGGSASNTLEGPFTTRELAEENCARILKQLRRKN